MIDEKPTQPVRSSPGPAPAKPPATTGAPPNDKPPAEIGRPPAINKAPAEIGGRRGPEPTRYGDWENGGKCVDF